MSLTERRAEELEAAWTPTDDLFGDEDDAAAFDFAAEPAPVEGLDTEQINRRLRALGHLQDRLADYDRAADAERDSFDARVERARHELEDRLRRNRVPLVEPVGYLTRVLELTGQAMLAKDPGRGTIALPAGKITVSGGGVEWVWDDTQTDELVKWAKTHAPAAYVPVPATAKVDKNKLKEAVKAAALVERYKRQAPAREDGTIIVGGKPVPGVTVKSKAQTFTPEPGA